MTERKKPAKKSTLLDPLKSFSKTASHSGGNSPFESSGDQSDHGNGGVGDEARVSNASPPIDIPTAVQEKSPGKAYLPNTMSSTTSYKHVDKQIRPSSSLPELSSSNDSEVRLKETKSPAAEKRTTSLTLLQQSKWTLSFVFNYSMLSCIYRDSSYHWSIKSNTTTHSLFVTS